MRVTRLFYEELKRHKPDGMHLGCAGHFWCAPYIDLNRTYDVHSSNWREHEQRALMLRHTTPGCPVSYDFHGVLENMEEWFASARRLGAAVEIGNVLYVRDDPFSDPRPADDQYYRTLRRSPCQRHPALLRRISRCLHWRVRPSRRRSPGGLHASGRELL